MQYETERPIMQQVWRVLYKVGARGTESEVPADFFS